MLTHPVHFHQVTVVPAVPSVETPRPVPAAVPGQAVPDESSGPADLPPARTPDDVPDKAPASKKKKENCKAARGARTRSCLAGECVGLLTAAATHCASLRSGRTALGKSQASAALLQAFVEATPAKDRSSARRRDIEQALRKIKTVRTKYMETRMALVQSSSSTAEREGALLAFGASVLYELARGVFKMSFVFNEATVREPVVIGSAPAVATAAADFNTGLAAAADVGAADAANAGTPAADSAKAATAADAGGAGAPNADGAGADPTGAAAEGPDDGETDGADTSAGSGGDDSDDGGAAAASAVNLLVAAEGSSPTKKPKRETTARVLREQRL